MMTGERKKGVRQFITPEDIDQLRQLQETSTIKLGNLLFDQWFKFSEYFLRFGSTLILISEDSSGYGSHELWTGDWDSRRYITAFRVGDLVGTCANVGEYNVRFSTEWPRPSTIQKTYIEQGVDVYVEERNLVVVVRSRWFGRTNYQNHYIGGCYYVSWQTTQEPIREETRHERFEVPEEFEL